MEEQPNKQFQKIKKTVKKAIISALAPVLIVALIICLIVTLICSVMYVITLDTGTMKDGSWDNVPYASSQYSSNVTIDEDGVATTQISAQEVWDKLVENKSNMTEYIKSPETLKKLLKNNLISFLGSDVHRTGQIYPKIPKALKKCISMHQYSCNKLYMILKFLL